MQEPTVVHSTFVIERTYPKPPERVFAALSEPGQKRRGMPRVKAASRNNSKWIPRRRP